MWDGGACMFRSFDGRFLDSCLLASNLVFYCYFLIHVSPATFLSLGFVLVLLPII